MSSDRSRQIDVEEEKDLESLFESLVENLPVHVARKNLAGRITFANQAFCRLLGMTREEVVGKSDYDFFPKELAEKYRHDDMLVERTGQTFSDIEANYSAGETRFFEVRKTPVRSRNGQIVGTQVIFWDVSAHKRTEAELDQERQLLNALLANTPDLIVFKDAEGRCIRVSRAFVHMVGLNDPADAIGKTDADFFAMDYAKRSREEELQVMRSGRSLVGKEEELTTADQRQIWVSTTKAPLRNYRGEVVGTFGIARDITNRKRFEEAQREAKEAAEAANQAKSDFLANMSHEIRTPLNAIIGMTELVLDSELSNVQQDYLQTVLTSGEALLGIINQILDFSKIEARKIELENVTFSLRDILGDTLKALAFHAHLKGLELAWLVESNVPETLIGDPTRINQIVVNLVGNAIKFTATGEVVLRVTGLKLNDQKMRLHITVSDTGIGIAPEQLEHVFSAFSQADTSTTREYGGTGLGLSISSRLAELMEGGIWVESELSRGSTFHVELVCEVVDAEPDERNIAECIPPGLRLLVVDDNATNRLILQETLKQWNTELTLLQGGPQVLEFLQQVPEGKFPQLMITDHQMPGMDGVQLVSHIRDNPAWSSLPVIVLTSGTRRFELPRLRQLGVELRLLKPVKPSELANAICSILGFTQQAVPVPTQNVVTQQELSILLVEDGWANQKLAAGLLKKWGHHVTIANNGQEAVDLVSSQAEPFHLVLMDVQMPVMDGLEATRQIRRMEAAGGRHLPILAMTAHVKTGDEQRCLEAGMDGYLSKPIRREQLQEAIAQMTSGVAAEKTPEVTDEEAQIMEMEDEGPGFNVELALDSVEGDVELLSDVIQVFLEERPGLLRSLLESIAAADAPTLRRAAHTIKGSTRIFGDERVTELSKALEDRGANGDFTDVVPLAEQLQIELNSLARHLERYLGSAK
ncbi:MAG: response regulator [Planctomycetales bacterium]|nr:response regulator [Planctomycetales bacterium]